MPQTHSRPSPTIRPALQSGAGATGFLITALPILILGLGGVELAHGLFVRQALSLALIQAGRAATVDHAHPDTLAQAFEQALQPLFPQAGSLPRALARRTRDLGQTPWQIRIIQPRRTAFTDHADPDARVATAAPGTPAINHDYQALQHQRRLRQGWPQGRGPASGQTIFQANTLMLELIWPHEPLVPGIRTLMRALSPGDASYRSRVLAHGYLPMMRGASLAMHSHPVRWPERSDGKVIHGEAANRSVLPSIACTGFWSRCTPASSQISSDTAISAPPPGDPEDAESGHHTDGPGPPKSEQADEPSADRDGHLRDAAPDAGESPAPACGVNSCCELP